MHITEFKILAVLAEEMNMRKAAERLYVSQPALSQRLQTIEKMWGTKIFIRSPRGLTVTPAGEKIIKYAQEVVTKEEKVREEIEALDEEVFGTLKLAVASIIGQYWLPKVLKRFVQTYPHVKISLMTGWSSEMLHSLYEAQVHVGIIRGDPDWKGKKMHIFSDNLYLVDTDISSVDELFTTNKPFIQFRSDSTYFQDIQDWWYSQIKQKPKRIIVVDQIETCKQLALHGIGFAILPSITISSIGENIFKIPLQDEKGELIRRDSWMLGYDTYMELPQVRAFVELVQEMVQSEEMET